MNVRFLRPEEAGRLEKFVSAHPDGSIEQSWDWGVLQCTVDGRDAFFVIGVFDEESNKLLGSMLVIRQDMGRGKTWLWCPRGPLLPKNNAERAWKLMKGKCQEVAASSGDIYLRIEPGATIDEERITDGAPASHSYMPEHTLIIDLRPSKEAILKQMKQKGRYNIKLAQKEGVYVREGTSEEISEFYEMLKETAVRDGFHLHGVNFYREFLNLLDGNAHFYLARIDHELVGGVLVCYFGKTATYYFGASSDKQRQKMAPYALQWFAIQAAKDDGMERYDFLGVAPEEDEKDSLAGVTQFKTRFGGNRVQYQKAEVFVYRRFWYLVVRIAKMFR